MDAAITVASPWKSVTVSYTHLDVYKRQLVLVGMDRDGAPRQAHIKGMRQRAFRYDAPGSDKAYGFRHMGGSGPVSYTHLDVYKRQMQRDAVRP